MSRFFTFFLCIIGPFMASSNAQIDSLKLALSHSGGAEKVKILNQLSELYRNANTERAHYYAKEALTASEEIGSPVLLAKSHINVGIIFRTIGQTQMALEHFTQALSFSEASKSLSLKADVYHKIGVTHLLVNDFHAALEYTGKETELWKRTSNKRGLANALNLAGLAHLNLNDYLQAEALLNQSLQISSELADQAQMYKPLVNLGDMYLQLKKPNEAIEYINRSRVISEQSGNKFGIGIAQLKLGNAYQQLGKLVEAQKSVYEALQTSEELNSLSLVRNSYKALAEINEQLGDFRAALQYNRLYIATEDSMLNEMTKRKIAELELKYNIEQKDIEIERLSEEAKYNRFTVAYIGSMLILVVVLSLVVYNRSQMKTNIKERLKNKESDIEITKKELVSKQSELSLMHAYANKIESLLIPGDELKLPLFAQFFTMQLNAQEQSMDFISYFQEQDIVYVVLGDCHGDNVEGNSMKKILIASMLHEVMAGNHLFTPAEILTLLNQQLSMLASQKNELLDTTADMAILSYQQGTKRLVYAGANIPVYYMNLQGLQAIEGENMPLGSSKYAVSRKFQNKAFTLKPGDALYLITRGLQEQTDESGKRTFSKSDLRNLLISMYNEPFENQKLQLLNAIDDWRGDSDYTRDITAIGLAT